MQMMSSRSMAMKLKSLNQRKLIHQRNQVEYIIITIRDQIQIHAAKYLADQDAPLMKRCMMNLVNSFMMKRNRKMKL